MRILIVDDHARDAAYLCRALREANRVVDLAPDLDTGLSMLADEVYEAVLIERRLAGADGVEGVEGVKRLRRRGFSLPVVLLTGEADAAVKAAALRAGCDDVVSRPYAFVELDARLDGLVARHRARAPGACLRVGALVLDLARREAAVDGHRLALTPREFLLLQRLARHPGEVVTRASLLEAAWDFEFEPPDHLIDRQMAALRQKVEAGIRARAETRTGARTNARTGTRTEVGTDAESRSEAAPAAGVGSSHEVIEVVRGVGYRLVHWA